MKANKAQENRENLKFACCSSIYQVARKDEVNYCYNLQHM